MLMFDLCAMWCKADQTLKESGEGETALTGRRHREVFCDLLLAELKKLQGKDLEPFLGESTADIYEQTYKLTLKFPFSKLRNGAATISELESNGTGDGDVAATQ